MFPGNTDQKDLGRALALSQVGMEMVAPIGLGMALDYWLGWLPWATITGAVVGLVGGIAHLVQLTSKKDSQNDKASRSKTAEEP
jgi:F0F1-type ATP synthase assembly protein I